MVDIQSSKLDLRDSQMDGLSENRKSGFVVESIAQSNTKVAVTISQICFLPALVLAVVECLY